ncbi:MAG: ribonuclease Z [Nautiliaceae bacterium]
MKFTFLGTSAGRPTKNRNVSALAFEINNEYGWYLFDCGEGTQHRVLQTHLSLYKLKNIFISHIHGDHVYGLFGLITSRMLDKCETPLKIYAPKGVKEMVEAVVDISYEHLGYELSFIEIYGGFEEEFENFNLKVLPLIHSVPSYAFYIKEKPRFKLDVSKLQKDGLLPSKEYQKIKNGKDVESNGKVYKADDYLIETHARSIIIAGDNAEPDFLCKYLRNLDLLIHEATYTAEVFEKIEIKYLHTTAKRLALSAQKYNVKNLIATHISPRFESIEILDEIKKYYKGEAFVANDFDIFELKGTICQKFL